MQLFFWIGLSGMALGAAVIGVLVRKSRFEDASQGVAHLFACVLGVFGYSALVSHQSEVHVGDRVVALAHYAYWLLSQPLILVAIALVGLPPLSDVAQSRPRATMVGSLIGTNVLWNLAALFQGLARDSAQRWTWFSLASLSLVALIWQLWLPVHAQGRTKGGGGHVDDYRLLVAILSVLWLAYLATWLLGDSGLRVWSLSVDTLIFVVLDLANDVTFGVFAIMLTMRAAERLSPEAGESTVAASARLAGSAGAKKTEVDVTDAAPERNASIGDRPRADESGGTPGPTQR